MTTPTTPTPDPAERTAERIESSWQELRHLGPSALINRIAAIIREEFAASGDTAELREALAQMLQWFGNTRREEWLNAEAFRQVTLVEQNARRVLARHTPGKEGV